MFIDIITMNLIFWPMWIVISYIPQYIMQKLINEY